MLGMGFASLFNVVCRDGNCVIKDGAPLKDVENKIFKKASKCYRYKCDK